MLIVLPSVVSGIGVLLVLLGITVDNDVVRKLALSAGVILLWMDFFITMAIFRRTVRSIDSRLKHIEERLPRD